MKKNRILTFAVLGAVGYWIYSRNKANKSLNPFAKSKSFASYDGYYGADGINPKRAKKTNYIAGGYDSTHTNPDGSHGATWMSYGGVGAQGYWVSGYVPRGSQTSNYGERP
jgi:hypothetical protein